MEKNKVLYLEFLKRILLGSNIEKEYVDNFFLKKEIPSDSTIEKIISNNIEKDLIEGMKYYNDSFTMIGLKRMNNLQESLDYIRLNNIEGDLVETGVWKGGATIFMKLYCDLYNLDKKIFVCDSFEGLPKPSGKFKSDIGDVHYTYNHLKISIDTVKNNFLKFYALDENVIFVKGFFSDTLPENKDIQKISILRMDGDMYESTYDVFYSLYHKVSDKGVVIVDDYCLKGCKDCVTDFINDNKINSELKTIDRCGIFWIK